MIDRPQTARSRRTAEALLEAAHELIEESGAEALTMAAVADRAGVSRRAVYLHFASRGDLVNALFERLQETHDADFTAVPAGEALDAWAAWLTASIPPLLATARAVQYAARTDPDAAQHWISAVSHRYAVCRRLMERLAAENALAPRWTSESATDMMLALSGYDVFETLLVDRRWSPGEVTEHLSRTFRAVFLESAS